MAGRPLRRMRLRSEAAENGGNVPMHMPDTVPEITNKVLKNRQHTPGAAYAYPNGVKQQVNTWLDRTYQMQEKDWVFMETCVKAQDTLVNLCVYLRFIEQPQNEEEALALIRDRYPKMAELIPFWRCKGNMELRAALFSLAMNGNFMALKMLLLLQLGITDSPKPPDDESLAKQASDLQAAMSELARARKGKAAVLNLAELE